MSCEYTAFLLTTSSDRATIGNEFNFTCNLAKDSNGIISIVRDHIDECIIDVDRTCRLLNCNPNYDYSCNGSTIILTLSGNFDIDSLHGSRWKCHDILRDMDSNEMMIYVNVEPVILKIPDINIKEGSNLKITPTIYANPAPISVWWTLQNVTDFRWYGRNLIFRNIQRDSRGNYTCYAMNTITASGQPPLNSTSADKFYVNVQCK
ncbi:unnamed protein product [Mytilus coruscus]|uniref:Ig-like domain-containing protein n=1 Tax=Mytilus coruscus TaxID=42192 RepID=A0A6J8EHP4_MYTCO|nr:unnamed protein product [Mytilus coruscus]